MQSVDIHSGGTILSVVVPAFNVEQYVGAALKSVLAQPRSKEIELIVVDDGSTDGTLEQILKIKASAPEHRITVVHQKNQGLSAARNVGIARATSRYIGFLDSDDEWSANFSDVIMPLLDTNAADIVEFNMSVIDMKGRIVDSMKLVRDTALGLRANTTEVLLEFARICQLHTPARVYRRELWEGVQFPVGHLYEDCHAIPLVYREARTLYGVPDRLYQYRRRPGSITQRITYRSVESVARFSNEALGRLGREGQDAYWLQLFHNFFANQCFLTSRVEDSALPASMKLVEATAARYRAFAAGYKKPLPALRYRTNIQIKRRVFKIKQLIKQALQRELRPRTPAPRHVVRRDTQRPGI